MTLNPVGVPDVTVSGLCATRSDEAAEITLGPFSMKDARRLLRYYEESNDEALAALIRKRLSEA